MFNFTFLKLNSYLLLNKYDKIHNGYQLLIMPRP